MDSIIQLALEGATGEELAAAEVPESYRAAHVRIEDVEMFTDVADKDVRESIHVGDVPMPELAPDEVLIAVMASCINFNTVWSAIFEPLPTFKFLKQLGRLGGWASRHDIDTHVLGSDASGVIVRVGNGVRNWNVGDHVVVAPGQVDDQLAATHNDAALADQALAWGYETNFGGLGDYSVARASQLIPKPAHLTWEEAASNALCAGTAYRMIVSDKGARLKQGDVVLIWGGAGGLGGFGLQFALNGGAIPVAVVSSDEKAEAVRKLGAELIIDRRELGLEPGAENWAQAGRQLGSMVRDLTGKDANIVFEHVGRATFAMSVMVARKGGSVVTCGSSSGYEHMYDNRLLWMRLKRIIGSHGANLQEQWETNELINEGRIATTMSAVYPLGDVGEAARLVQANDHIGKVAVLCASPEEGLGVTDMERRDSIGESRVAPLYNGFKKNE